MVEQADKWALQIALIYSGVSVGTPNFLYSDKIHFLTVLAFIIVSAVVKVLEFTKTKVSSTFNP